MENNNPKHIAIILDGNRRFSKRLMLEPWKGHEFGRDKVEKSVIWIEKGMYQGYGFAPYHFHGKTPKDWSRYITLQKENKDIKTILNVFLRKENKFKIIEL